MGLGLGLDPGFHRKRGESHQGWGIAMTLLGTQKKHYRITRSDL